MWWNEKKGEGSWSWTEFLDNRNRDKEEKKDSRKGNINRKSWNWTLRYLLLWVYGLRWLLPTGQCRLVVGRTKGISEDWLNDPNVLPFRICLTRRSLGEIAGLGWRLKKNEKYCWAAKTKWHAVIVPHRQMLVALRRDFGVSFWIDGGMGTRDQKKCIWISTKGRHKKK